MPIRVRVKGGEYIFITPTKQLSPVEITGATKDNIEIDYLNYYVGALMD
jgi:hypothetical protein